MKANLTTGKIEPGEGDPALAGAHGRPDLDAEITRQVQRMAKEEAAKRKAERAQLKADRATAKALLEQDGEKMVRVIWAVLSKDTSVRTLHGDVIKRLRSEAWYAPDVVIHLHARLAKEGKL